MEVNLTSYRWLQDVYKRSFYPKHPVVCMDESPKQLIKFPLQLHLDMLPGMITNTSVVVSVIFSWPVSL